MKQFDTTQTTRPLLDGMFILNVMYQRATLANISLEIKPTNHIVISRTSNKATGLSMITKSKPRTSKHFSRTTFTFLKHMGLSS